MTGDFRLIDYINDLFLGKPYHMLYEHLENECMGYELHGIIFYDVLTLFEKRLKKFTIH